MNTKGREEYAIAILKILDPDNSFHLLDHFIATTEKDTLTKLDRLQK